MKLKIRITTETIQFNQRDTSNGYNNIEKKTFNLQVKNINICKYKTYTMSWGL